MAQEPGRIVLVGAGPGRRGLITVRGLECLRAADVVVYDALANEELLRECSAGCERIFAGKRAGQQAMAQADIEALLVERARAGKFVVRLKGGDPYVFGRGGEETAASLAAGIPCEVVPGVTSAVAVPAYAGLPVTHRGVSAQFHVFTGHEDRTGVSPPLDWESIARLDGTLVFLMAVSSLAAICGRLMASGCDPTCAAALVRWGSRAEQRVLTGTVDSIAGVAQAANFTSPAVMVIGDVVRLRPGTDWLADWPLASWCVALTRPAGENARLRAALDHLQADVIETPLIQFEAVRPADGKALLPAQESGEPRWLLLTSAHGVTRYFEELDALGADARALHGVRIACVGSRTAEVLASHGVRADLVPAEPSQAGLAAALLASAGGEPGRALLPCAQDADKALADGLAAGGWSVARCVLYRVRPDDEGCARLARLLDAGRVNAVTFTAGSVVRAFAEAVGSEQAARLLAPATRLAMGTTAARALGELGVPPHAVCEPPCAEDMALLLAQLAAAR